MSDKPYRLRLVTVSNTPYRVEVKKDHTIGAVAHLVSGEPETNPDILAKVEEIVRKYELWREIPSDRSTQP